MTETHSRITGTAVLPATPSFIAAAMVEHGKPTTPPIVPPHIKPDDTIEAKAQEVEQSVAYCGTDTAAPAVTRATHDEGGKPRAS